MTEHKLAQNIGKIIRRLRKAQKITAEKLAYENGLSKGYLSNIENGNRLPSLKHLVKIANALDVEVWELLKPLSKS